MYIRQELETIMQKKLSHRFLKLDLMKLLRDRGALFLSFWMIMITDRRMQQYGPLTTLQVNTHGIQFISNMDCNTCSTLQDQFKILGQSKTNV